MGAMATAISHEINQPLIAIQNYAQAVKRRLQSNVDDKSKFIELFEKIEEQAARAGAITQRVRSLVSTSDVQLLPVSLYPLVGGVVRMIEPETERRGCRIGSGIRKRPSRSPCRPFAGSACLGQPSTKLDTEHLLERAIRQTDIG